MRGIFRQTVDAPATKGRWQSAEQLLGSAECRETSAFHSGADAPGQLLPTLLFLFRLHVSFPLCVFLMIITDPQHTFSVVHHCFQMKVGSQGPEPGDKAGLSLSSL